MSTTLIVLYAFEIALVVLGPIAAVLIMRRRWSLPMTLAIAGGATFVASQILHLPANNLLARALNITAQPVLLQAIFLGLSAGIFEEVARYLAYRYWQKDARSWRQAVFFGLGHGGTESIITGVVVAATLLNVIVISRTPDPTTLGIPQDQVPQLLAEVQAFWATPWYIPLVAVAERVMAITMHLGLSTLVVIAFRKGGLWALPAAILWHAFADAVATYVGQMWGPLAAEAALFIIALMSVALLWVTHRALAASDSIAGNRAVTEGG